MTARTKTTRAFELLGIAPTYDHKEIRSAWRAMVRTYHPDLAKSDRAAANARLVEINEAFDTVMAAASELEREAQMDARKAQDVARRMAAARRAEARRAAEAREAAEEQRLYQEAKARKATAAAREKAAMRAAHARQTADAGGQSARQAGAEATKTDVAPSRRNPLSEAAARSFARAIRSFSKAPAAARHNTTC